MKSRKNAPKKDPIPPTGKNEISGNTSCAAPDAPVPQKGILRRLPRFARVLYALALLSAAVYLAMLASPSFADFYNVRIGSFFRAALSWLTVLLPFSAAELMIILLLPTVIFLAVFACRRFSDTWRQVGVFSLSLISVLSLFFSLFALGFGAGYRGTTLDEKMGLERAPVAVGELTDTAGLLVGKINENLSGVTYTESGASDMPYSYTEMCRRLMRAYDKVCDEYDFIQRLHSRVKPVMLSKPWTYTHITGVYTYFTGEANINVNMPDYTIPFTAAHELAHQRGIAREDEANFVAFLVCAASDDEYVRYSGYLSMFEYVGNALYRADRDAYWAVLGTLDERAVGEMRAYNEFFKKYEHNVAASVSGTINNAYLTIQGTPGVQSYGMVVDLCVAYYKGN